MEYLERSLYKTGGLPPLMGAGDLCYMDSLSQLGRESAFLPGRYWPPLFWYYYTGYGYPPPPMTDLFSPTHPIPEPWPSWYGLSGELAYKSSVDHRESPNKELPTKLLKYERMKDRHELPQTLNFDKEHSAKLNSKKCAGTQTSYSSFLADRYLPGESGRREAFSATPGCTIPQDIRQPSLSPIHRRSPPPAYPHSDSQNTPLNLSLGNIPNDSHSHGSGPLHQQLRPSVITCTPSVVNGTGNKYGSNDNVPAFSTARREVNTVAVCDPAIEEHFRRSLGKDYPECLSSKSSSRSSSPTGQTSPLMSPQTSPSGQQEQAVSITGSVDDHFAKSLGDSTWSQIKAKNDPVHFDLFTGSVDDHFAKALGDTWLRIKAEKESGPPNSSSCSSPSSSPRQHTSPIST